MVSIGYQRNLQDVRSRQTLQVWKTTHFIQELLLTPPLFKRTARPAPPTLPRTIWEDVHLAGSTTAAFVDALQQRMRMLPTHAHVYQLLNLASPPHSDAELHFDIYMDGSYTPPRRDNGYEETPAGRSFVVACNQPVQLGRPME